MGSRPRHILVVDRNPNRKDSAPAGLSPHESPIVTKVVSTVSDAIPELSKAGYDAVILRVEGPHEMSLVLRIKTAAPSLPVVAVVPEATKDIQQLAEENGADKVIGGNPGGGAALRRSTAPSPPPKP